MRPFSSTAALLLLLIFRCLLLLLLLLGLLRLLLLLTVFILLLLILGRFATSVVVVLSGIGSFLLLGHHLLLSRCELRREWLWLHHHGVWHLHVAPLVHHHIYLWVLLLRALALILRLWWLHGSTVRHLWLDTSILHIRSHECVEGHCLRLHWEHSWLVVGAEVHHVRIVLLLLREVLCLWLHEWCPHHAVGSGDEVFGLDIRLIVRTT